ncbi:MAG: hypothetical protein RLZZ308_165 [Candidatus Parcubacteria bacterium]|jgi:phenylalanyl-tRNA synthetase beta subunit
MKFFKPWLQDYIIETLPEDAVIVESLNKKAFEVEEVLVTASGTVFDIKVLPNRAHDALGHYGMAYELCAVLSLTFKKDMEIKEDNSYLDALVYTPSVLISDELACTRFASLRIDNITVGESPVWLKERLEAIGQRSINAIVDITNYVQFSLNKPMHAYDAETIVGSIQARYAKEGETLITLDEKVLTLDTSTLVIADDEKVLGLAGIKGGKWSGISSTTTSVILESANFDPVHIRKTAEKYAIRTDASKRFENGIANSLVIEGLHMTANLIKDIYPNVKKSYVCDVYPKKDVPYHVGITVSELNAILGTQYDDAMIEKTFKQLSFSYECIVPYDYIHTLYPTLIGALYKNPSSMRYDAPASFSCSSLISYLYKGVWMPSLSIDKYVFSNKITHNECRFGDLVFANSGEGVIRYESVAFLRGTHVPEGVDHVGLFLENGNILHATKLHGVVVEETYEEFAKGRVIVGFGRVVSDLSEKRYVVTVPATRLDIRIKEDLAEEIGRIVGYDTLTPLVPSLNRVGLPHKRMYYENKVRAVLLAHNFSEIITYSFGNEGDVKLKKGLAEDKELLRSTLGSGMKTSFASNLYNAPLIGEKTIRVFQFGSVFKGDSEFVHFSIGIDDGAKKSSFVEEGSKVMLEIKDILAVESFEYETVSVKPYVVELNFETLIAPLGEPSQYEASTYNTAITTYTPISPYPFITRDIAVWVPSDILWNDIATIINSVRDVLITRIDLFDTFIKSFEDGTKKTSYAFRLVIQSYKKTLTDEEANSVAGVVYNALQEKGWEIR